MSKMTKIRLRGSLYMASNFSITAETLPLITNKDSLVYEYPQR